MGKGRRSSKRSGKYKKVLNLNHKIKGMRLTHGDFRCSPQGEGC